MTDRFDEMAKKIAASSNVRSAVAMALRLTYADGRASAFAECIDRTRSVLGSFKGGDRSAQEVLASLKSRAGNDGTAWIRNVCKDHVEDERKACAAIARAAARRCSDMACTDGDDYDTAAFECGEIADEILARSKT